MTDLKTKKSIVIYFSRADENYGVWYRIFTRNHSKKEKSKWRIT